MKYPINMLVNGAPVEAWVSPSDSLLTVLRDTLRLTGAKKGCDHGDCGSCTVVIDEKAYKSCIMPAMFADGKSVLTVEGLEIGGRLARLQRAFIEYGAPQCGFCTPGILMAAQALFIKNQSPSRAEIVEAISGNLCRCTGYYKYIEAIEAVANDLDVAHDEKEGAIHG